MADRGGARESRAGERPADIRRVPWSSLGRALGYLRPYWRAATVALVSLLLVTATTLITPQFVRVLIDRGIIPGQWSWIALAAAGLLAAALVRGVFNFLQGYLSERASQGVAFDLRNVIYERIQTLSFSYHDTAQTGQLMTRMTSDVENVRAFVGQGFLTFVSASLTLIGTALVLFATDWLLALVALAVVPVIFAIMALFVTRVVPRFRLIQQKIGLLNTVLQENLAGLAVIKAFAREPFERSRYERANRDLLDENLSVVRALAASFPSVFLVANLGTLAVIWVGGEQVIGGRLTLGTLVAFNTYLAFLLMPILQLGFIVASVSRAGVSAQRVFEVMDTESEVHDRPGAATLDRVAGRVDFDHVTFRYAGETSAVLDDVSFTVEPGETIAILGTTGSGKSTILNLIPRFYDVTAGAVRIDGCDVRDLLLASLRCHVGVVLQESVLFGGTIRENIAYGRPDAPLERVVAAARAAQADDFIAELPEGYDTIVGERGVTLSGGQRQRISIARTLLLDPKILLLDDATSSVDAETESRLQLALRQLMAGRTSFIIAQRLSTVRLADRILIVDQGRLAAQGTHAQLAEDSCLYAEIVASQLMPDVAREREVA
jgi:ATP-binding cassette subfamily B multidrug efflux pump